MNVQWWCAAGTGPWTWSWQAYPGVWIFQLLLLAAYVAALRRPAPPAERAGEPAAPRGRVARFLVGWALLWVLLDWPVGPLAAGYLLSAHMLQYVLISLLIAPLLEEGLPHWLHRRLLARPALAPLRWWVDRPFACFMALNGVLVATHVPLVADTLKPMQFGSMLIDLLWVGSAFLFWWSLREAGARGELSTLYGKRLLYMLGIKLVPIVIGGFFVFSDFPIYATFELAPRATELSARHDQSLAGWLMLAGATPLLIYRLGTAWFAWYAWENRRPDPA